MKRKDKDEGVLQGSRLPYQCWKVEASGLFRGVYLLTKVCANKDLARTYKGTAALYLGKVNAVCRANSL